VKDSWYIPVQIGGKCYHLLYDNGSAITIISPKLYKRTPMSVKTPLVAPAFRLRSASIESLSVSGLCCLEMELGNKMFPSRVLVADVNYDGIIGSDFLEHCNGVIDVAQGLLQLPHLKIYMAKGRKPSVCRVKTSSDVEIPAHTQMILPCHVVSHCKMTTLVSVVEPTRKTVSKYGILVGRCLVNTGNLISVLTLNPGPMPVLVTAGSSIALLKSISYLDDLSVDELFGDTVGLPHPYSWTGVQSTPYTDNCGRSSPDETARNVRVSTLHSNNVPNSYLTADHASAPVDGSLVPVHSSVNSMVPDGSLSRTDSIGRGTSMSDLLVSGNPLPEHSSVNSMVEGGNSLLSGYASSWEENESSTLPTTAESLSHQRVTSWYCTPEYNLNPLLDPLPDVDDNSLAASDVESMRNSSYCGYFHTRDAFGEPIISLVHPEGKDSHYLPQDEYSTMLPFTERVSNATYDLVRSDTDSDSSEDLVSSQKSGESTESDYSISDYSDQDGEIPACRVNLVERWTRPLEPPVYLSEHLMGLINCNLPKENQYELAKTLCDYKDIFVSPNRALRNTGVTKYDIVKSTEQPVKNKSNIVLVRKKNGSIRFCIDYRNGNNIMPIEEGVTNTSNRTTLFCSLNIATGHWQATEGAKSNSAFVTGKPFGLSNAPATFEHLMELVQKGMTWRQCVVYIDDIIVFGTNFQETHQRLINVFDLFRQSHLCLKPKQCHLFKDSTLYSRYQVSAHGVEPDPAKLEAIRTLSSPVNLKGLHALLTTLRYHQRFIPNFAHIAEPLVSLARKRKNPVFVWEKPQQDAFIALRSVLLTTPVLSHPSLDGKFILDANVSDYAITGALYQLQNGKLRVISYASKTLTNSQRKYCTTKRELLAVVRMVQYFRHNLWGNNFTIYSDEATLSWFLQFKDADGMLAKWLAELAPFQFTIRNREEVDRFISDGSTRRRCEGCPRPDCPDKLPPSPASLVSPSMVIYHSTLDHVPEPDKYTPDEIRELQMQDSDISPVLKWKMSTPDRPPSQDETVRESPETQALIASWHRLVIDSRGVLNLRSEDVSRFPNRYVAPKAIRLEILLQCHDNVLSEHPGVKRTQQQVRLHWYWPQYHTDIVRYVSSCIGCAQRKLKSPLQKQLVNITSPRFKIGDLVRCYYVGAVSCYIGPYQILGQESDFYYKICGKFRNSGGKSIRVVHTKHLMHYEQNETEISDIYSSSVLTSNKVNKNKSPSLLASLQQARTDISCSDTADLPCVIQQKKSNENSSPACLKQANKITSLRSDTVDLPRVNQQKKSDERALERVASPVSTLSIILPPHQLTVEGEKSINLTSSKRSVPAVNLQCVDGETADARYTVDGYNISGHAATADEYNAGETSTGLAHYGRTAGDSILLLSSNVILEDKHKHKVKKKRSSVASNLVRSLEKFKT